MAFPTTNDLDTELSSVNSILGAIGQSPVTNLDYTNPEISFVYNIFSEANRDVQNEGWSFNSERCYPVKPDGDGIIYIPDNMLRLDMSGNAVDRTTDVVRREGKLYDKMAHSYVFDPTKTYEMDVVWMFDFIDIPSVFKRYITYRASVRAATQMVTNKELAQMLSQQEAYSRAACMEYECNQGDATFFGTPDDTIYRSYQPYRTLAR